MGTILETIDLVKIYGSGESEVKALDGVSISVRRGITAIGRATSEPENPHSST